MPQAYIVEAVRTAGGRRGGRLAGVHPVDLAAKSLDAIMERSGLEATAIDDVVMGCVSQGGEQAMQVGRGDIVFVELPEVGAEIKADEPFGSVESVKTVSELYAPINGTVTEVNEVVVASQDSHVYLLDADSGRQRLMFDTGFQRFGGGPAIHGDTVYFSSDRGWLWAIDRRAKSYPGQRKLWRVKINLYVWQVISSRPNQPGGLWSKRVGGELQGLLLVHEHPDAPAGGSG